MTQLILDTTGYNIVLPESVKDGYKVYKEELASEVQMISGRMVKELRGNVWHISYQYGFFDDATKNNLISACEKGKAQSITCSFLTPDSTGALTTSRFLVTTFNYPKFMWSRNVMQQQTEDGTITEISVPVPMWGDFSVELREVKPSD